MPGPAPKHRSLRARRNKASSRAKLRSRRPKKGFPVRAPALPSRACHCGGPVEPPKPRPRAKAKRGAKKKPRARTRKAPPCTTCEGTGILPWHHLTQIWWRRLWASPMGPEYLESDLDELYVFAALRDALWQAGGADKELAGEVRLWGARFGSTPIDRRKLQWEVEREAEQQAAEDDTPLPSTMVDPRVVPEVPAGRPN